MSRRSGCRGWTLVELAIAAPITWAALAVGLVVCASWTARVAGAAADPVLTAMPALETLRRDVREARDVVYPRPGDRDVAAQALMLRDRTGALIGYRVEAGALTRTAVGEGPPRRLLAGVERVAVRRLGGKQPLIRVGLSRRERAVVLLSAELIAPSVKPSDGASESASEGAREGARSGARDGTRDDRLDGAEHDLHDGAGRDGDDDEGGADA